MSGLDVKLELIGDKDVERMLRGWSPAAQRRITRPGITKGARIVASAARRNAPKETGLLRMSIGHKVRTYRTGVVVGVIGPRKGYRRPVAKSGGRWTSSAGGVASAKADPLARVEVRDPVKYAHLVHGGTAAHALGKGSVLVVRSSGKAGAQGGKRHPGTAANPFLRRAFDSSITAVRAVMRQSIRENVAREARRLLKERGLAA